MGQLVIRNGESGIVGLNLSQIFTFFATNICNKCLLYLLQNNLLVTNFY